MTHTTALIHPTAVVSSDVDIETGVSIGAFAVVEGPGRVGEGTVIESHAMIRPHVYLGKNNHVHPHAVLGGLPQDLGFDAATVTRCLNAQCLRKQFS